VVLELILEKLSLRRDNLGSFIPLNFPTDLIFINPVLLLRRTGFLPETWVDHISVQGNLGVHTSTVRRIT